MNSVLIAYGLAAALGHAPQSDADLQFWRKHLGDPKVALHDYLAKEVRTVAESSRMARDTASSWKAGRDVRRREFREMLGLEPMPPRTDLRAKITGTIRAPELGITIEKLHFQSMPGLYVTANLYRPIDRKPDTQLPAILYLCGHGREVHGGYSYGNKTHYLHHPTWFARNGFVCLIVDTLQLGEIQGLHAGTLRGAHWWWVRRGYTPAGVEAWNSVRALDYLCSLPEVDAKRIGVTGRSGGGVGTWHLAAIDDRPAALVPVAGLTDLHNHVITGCIDSHCDCNYFLNYYGWDFPRIAALAAPRPLLLANSDNDGIFPLDGVMRLHGELRHAYGFYGARSKLGLSITPGPHGDTPELRVPAFRWMMRFLKNDKNALIEPAETHFKVQQMRVFASFPKDARNRSIQESFVAAAPRRSGDLAAWQRRTIQRLRATTFRTARTPTDTRLEEVRRVSDGGVLRRDFVLHTGDVFRLPLRLWTPLRPSSKDDRSRPLILVVHAGGQEPTADQMKRIRTGKIAVATIVPRGLGALAWSGDAGRRNRVRRRFLVLGRTLDQTRIHDVRAAIHALRTRPELRGSRMAVHGRGATAELALFAAILEPAVDVVRLTGLAKDRKGRLALPGLNRIVHDADLSDLAHPRTVHIE